MATAAALVLLLASPVFGPGPEPPSKTELASITARGRMLFEYDQAAWHATDAVRRRHPKKDEVTRYIARKMQTGWVVVFGHWKKVGVGFMTAYEATQGRKLDDFQVKAFHPPREELAYFPAAARAMGMALADFQIDPPEVRPYNTMVLPAANGQWWVYLVPVQTEANVWPLGGDTRYLISKEGLRIMEKRPLHATVLEREPPQEPDQVPVSAYHTHVLTDLPEDTDVFHVLSRKPAVPEMIVTKHFVFQIETSGTIKYLGTIDEVFKKKE